MENPKIFKLLDEGRTDKVIELLENGTDPNSTNKYHTPLIIKACTTNNLELLKVLVEQYNIDTQNTSSSGFSGIYLAIIHGNFDVVEYLINKEPDINILNSDGSRLCLINVLIEGFTYDSPNKLKLFRLFLENGLLNLDEKNIKIIQTIPQFNRVYKIFNLKNKTK